MYTCIIVDDQASAVDLIKDHVQKTPLLSILLATIKPIEALAFLEKQKPDIIFLDIEMPDMTGMEFIETLKSRWGNKMPKIVFTTGYSNYALSGYEHGVVDYILKPVSFIRFKKCIDRIFDDLGKHALTVEKPAFFFVEEEGKKIKINFDEVVYVEAAGNYIILVLDNARMIIYKSISTIQEQLPDDRFVRVHKSFIVAIAKIHAIRGTQIFMDKQNPEKVIPIGVTYKDEVLKRLGLS